jgi:hypothetical protein
MYEWTTTPPTRTGWYWAYAPDTFADSQVRVAWVYADPFDHEHFVAHVLRMTVDAREIAYWMGPLDEPPPPTAS